MRRRLDCWRVHREVEEVGYSETRKTRMDPVSLTAREKRRVEAPGGRCNGDASVHCEVHARTESGGWG